MPASLTYTAQTAWGFRCNRRDQVAEHAQALADYLYEITAIRSTFPDSEDVDQFNKQTVKLGSLIGAFLDARRQDCEDTGLEDDPCGKWVEIPGAEVREQRVAG